MDRSVTAAGRPSLPTHPSAALFDLDGTISESGAAIVRTLRQTLDELGLPPLTDDVAQQVVGPPLGQTLRELVGVPKERVPGVIAHYRALLATRLDQTPAYDGMPELVRDLAAAGLPLAVATSKVVTMAERVIAAYGLTDCFVAICGSGPDEVAGTKAAVVAEALARLRAAGVDVGAAVMVGDRHHDVDGAAEHGLPTIAVTWGYGVPAEWSRAAAVAASPAELRTLLAPPGPVPARRG